MSTTCTPAARRPWPPTPCWDVSATVRPVPSTAPTVAAAHPAPRTSPRDSFCPGSHPVCVVIDALLSSLVSWLARRFLTHARIDSTSERYRVRLTNGRIEHVKY